MVTSNSNLTDVGLTAIGHSCTKLVMFVSEVTDDGIQKNDILVIA
jgi:hypothetical protein